MKWLLTAFVAITATTAFAGSHGNWLRTDCRFYSEHRFCYSSAIYKVEEDGIHHIRYGVGCDYETIFDDEAVASPQSTVSDSIRPANAAIPRLEVTPQGSLEHPGTYTAKLELVRERLDDGTCYVSEVDSDDSRRFFEGWFYQQ